MTVVDLRWPDRHPRSKPQTCDLCGKQGRLYTVGARCDAESPGALRAKAAQKSGTAA